MERHNFLNTLGLGIAVAVTLAIAVGTVVPAKALAKEKKYSWRMTTTWPPKSPVLHEGCERFVKQVETMSQGRIKIELFAAGELIPAFEAFEAVQQGTMMFGSSTPYYWAGKIPEAQFFSSIPFGFNFQQMYAWLYGGGGLKLWQEAYAPHNVMVLPFMNTGVQMGGWFNKEIKSVKDLAVLKMRIPGLGGKVMSKAGVNVNLLPASEIFPALERGVIDATEWIGPTHDRTLGLHQAAKYYYYPGWHEPGTMCELLINKKTWDSLTPDFQEMIKCAAIESTMWSLAAFESQNGDNLEWLVKHGVQLRKWPDDVLDKLSKLSQEFMEEESAKNPNFKKVYESFLAFKKKINSWAAVSESSFYNDLMKRGYMK